MPLTSGNTLTRPTMQPSDLDRFATLALALRELTPPVDLAKTFMAKRLYPPLRSRGMDYGFVTADDALTHLLRRFSMQELRPQLRPLFGRSEGNWEQAVTELLGLVDLDKAGLLSAVGWPSHDGSLDAEFDALLTDLGGGPIALDIKSGAKSGLRLLEEKLQEVVDEWAEDHGLPESVVEIDYEGPVDRELLGEGRVALAEELGERLARLTDYPADVITLTPIRTTKTTITVRSSDGYRSHKGGFGLDSHADNLRGTFFTHVKDKGESAARLGTPFFIAYVKPRGFGLADIDRTGMEAAVRSIHLRVPMGLPNERLWLGSSLLDFTEENPYRGAFLRPKAAWPSGTTAAALTQRLNLDLWPERLRGVTIAAF